MFYQYWNTVLQSPQYLLLIDKIESIQRYFTKRLFDRVGIPEKSYPDRLQHLKLEPLELRRLKNDLCMCYKIVHKDIKVDTGNIFTIN